MHIPYEKKDDINYINNIRKDYIKRYIERGKRTVPTLAI